MIPNSCGILPVCGVMNIFRSICQYRFGKTDFKSEGKPKGFNTAVSKSCISINNTGLEKPQI